MSQSPTGGANPSSSTPPTPGSASSLDAPVVGIEQHPHRLATVLRVTTRLGQVWFKATTTPCGTRPRSTAWSPPIPGPVPAPLATDPGTGWMLLADAGTRLRESSAARAQPSTAARRARGLTPGFQLACRTRSTPCSPRLPDRRLHTAPRSTRPARPLDGADRGSGRPEIARCATGWRPSAYARPCSTTTLHDGQGPRAACTRCSTGATPASAPFFRGR